MRREKTIGQPCAGNPHARRRLESALFEGIESGISDETTEALLERLRATLPPRKKRGRRAPSDDAVP